MKLTVSEVKTFLSDQQEWWYAYVEKRVPRLKPVALASGSYYHKLMEEYFRIGSKEHAISATEGERLTAVAELGLPHGGVLLAETDRLQMLFNLWEDKLGVARDSIAIEEAMEEALPKIHYQHFLQGKPDRVVKHNDLYWHWQNRTLSTSVSISTYLMAAQRDLHELSYAFLIQRRLNIEPEQYGGTIFNITRKLSRKSIEERPEEAFVQEFVSVDPKQVQDALLDIAAVGDYMTKAVAGNQRIIQNREMDRGRFGNSLSPYFNVKIGREKLDSETFQNATDRYAEAAHAEAIE